jgi:hypothetical protein
VSGPSPGLDRRGGIEADVLAVARRDEFRDVWISVEEPSRDHGPTPSTPSAAVMRILPPRISSRSSVRWCRCKSPSLGHSCAWLTPYRQIRPSSLVGPRTGSRLRPLPFQIQVDRVTRGPALAFAESGFGPVSLIVVGSALSPAA